MVDLHKVGYNQGYLATVKLNEKYIFKIKIEKNDHKNMNMKDKCEDIIKAVLATIKYKLGRGGKGGDGKEKGGEGRGEGKGSRECPLTAKVKNREV